MCYYSYIIKIRGRIIEYTWNRSHASLYIGEYLPLFSFYLRLLRCVWIDDEFSKRESRLPWKIAKQNGNATTSIYKQSCAHFCKILLKVRLSGELHLYIPARALALSRNSSKLENAFASRLVRRASRFTLNPVRKRSARPSISRVRREDAAQDAAEMLWISSRWRKVFLSLSFRGNQRDGQQLHIFLEFCVIWDNVHSPSSSPCLSLPQFSPRCISAPRYISLRCTFSWLCSCTNETRWIVIKYTLLRIAEQVV